MGAPAETAGRFPADADAERGSARYCCATGSATCFWLGIFAVLWGSVMLLQLAAPALRPYTSALVLAAAGIACLVNFRKNRTLHCALTGPFFLLIAAVLALVKAGLLVVSLAWVWPVVLIGVGVALLVEWRFASRV